MAPVVRAISAKYIFDGTNLHTNKVVLMANNLILNLVESNNLPQDIQVEHFANCVISPGLIDLQLNGCGGVLFNDDISLATLETMHQTNLKYATMGFLPTLITSKFSDVIQALNVVKQWFDKYGNSRGVLGLHLEGPFLSTTKRGIHPLEYIIEPTAELLDKIVHYAQFYPLKITLAPEVFSAEQISYLVRKGVIVAVGHSNASYEQAELAFKHGAQTATHMFNAMSGLTGRNPGVIGAVLANAPYLGLIVDLLHVDKANVNLLAKLRSNSVYLVTDAVTPTGTELSEFKFAGKQLYVKDGRCVDDSGTLGGAYLTLNTAVANCVKHCHISLEQALAMASRIPAQVLKLDHELGKIAPNYRANLVAINLSDYSATII
jgi:N-acetylglucosamine-6-phosphate deacetylase